MSYLPEFLLIAGAHLAAVASPGPDFALVLRQSVTFGRRIGIATSLGVGSGILVHVAYSLLGVGVLIRGSALWFDVVKYAGAAYLVWIAVGALRTRPRAQSAGGPAAEAETPAVPSAGGAFRTGFVVNVLNPKAALFFIGLFLTAISPATPKTVQAVYGLWLAVATAGWFCLVATVFTRPAVRDHFLRIGHWFDRAMGVLLLALAARLALASL